MRSLAGTEGTEFLLPGGFQKVCINYDFRRSDAYSRESIEPRIRSRRILQSRRIVSVDSEANFSKAITRVVSVLIPTGSRLSACENVLKCHIVYSAVQASRVGCIGVEFRSSLPRSAAKVPANTEGTKHHQKQDSPSPCIGFGTAREP